MSRHYAIREKTTETGKKFAYFSVGEGSATAISQLSPEFGSNEEAEKWLTENHTTMFDTMLQPPPLNPGFSDSQILAAIRRFTSSIMFLKQLAGDRMFEECVMHWLAISPEESKKRLTLTLATTTHQDLLEYFRHHPWFNGKNGSDKDETERIKQEITASFELCEKIRSLPQDKRSQIEAIINS